MNKIFVTSDTHFGHNKEFLYEPRGFNSIQEHDEKIIENWNRIIDIYDDVYHLGDVMLGDNEHGLECLKRLKGRVHIILGNHDTDSRVKLYRSSWNVVEVDKAITLKWKGFRFHLTHYPTITSNHDDDKPVEKKIINLCGHTHTQHSFKDWDIAPIYHAELDAHSCYPVSLDEIINDIFDWRKY